MSSSKAKFHISDDGMPGKCTAESDASCPKVRAGDSFHADSLEEAMAESTRRFEAKLGAVATVTRAEVKRENQVQDYADRFSAAVDKMIADPSPENRAALTELRVELGERIRNGDGAGLTSSSDYRDAEARLKAARVAAADSSVEVFRHPQGKIIEITQNSKGQDVVTAYKDGKVVTTSATADELRSGYGRWERDRSRGKAPLAPTGSIAMGKEEKAALVDAMGAARVELREAKLERLNMGRRHSSYDELHADAEGRSYHYDLGKVIPGRNPHTGKAFYHERPEHAAERAQANERIARAEAASRDAQTAVEEAGLGQMIPDGDGHVLRVRTQAQKWLLEDELKGQISDGHWENSSGNPWQDWTSAKVIVDPENVGRNFYTAKDNYQLNAKVLLDVVGDRMVENVKERTGRDYDEGKMQADLRDLRAIFKTHRKNHPGATE